MNASRGVYHGTAADKPATSTLSPAMVGVAQLANSLAQLRARNGVEEPAQDFHVRGHVVVVDGGSASRQQAATSHPQHGKPWSWEAGESQTAAGGWSNQTNASAAKATAVVADVTTHSKWRLDMQV